jgi:hypothetical protein
VLFRDKKNRQPQDAEGTAADIPAAHTSQTLLRELRMRARADRPTMLQTDGATTEGRNDDDEEAMDPTCAARW